MADRRGVNGRRGEKKRESFFDYTLLFIVLFLLGFGLVMLYSTSSYDGGLQYGDPAYFLKKQLSATIIGLAAMMVVANIPYHFWERFAVLGYLGSAVMILLIIPFGYEAGGAKRWIRIMGLRRSPNWE